MRELVFLIPIAGIVMAGFVLTPLARALARRLERGSSGGAEVGDVEALRDELAQWKVRVEEVEGIAARLDELEERVDFTERLLVKGRDGAAGVG